MGQWILNVAASKEETQKKELLAKLSSTLSIFDQSIPKVQNPSSLFFVKTILRFGKLNIEKLTEQTYNFIPETLKATGEALGIAT